MTSHQRAVVVAVAGALALAGCTGGPSPTDTASPGPVSSAAAADEPVVCGVAVGDVELATGLSVGRSDDQIVVRDGAGTGRCEAFSDDADGELVVVEMYELDDVEAQQVRAAIDGDEPSAVRVPDIRFDPDVADGAAWGVTATPNQNLKQAPHSRVFWGDTMIYVYLTQTASWRAGADDLLAMTFQVAQSYGLERPDPLD
ncbi:hypothetical protein J1G42_01705 [Cellulomonas sp. zg-ZUI222]|uniref:DUF3558 domain-containing protein n=1 Tax=Cellulomonas wangleii TaxID=2816956 RepID=A0ABX8D5G5_9CELL|nr:MULTISPECIES: hypothetical protein [Cellulomonas]MBO0898674.1 hypothetical protein [Cellulomonas sp. zg-ZUI22]MBO0919537.1 hypothetical protein [Cellulomonas wangleii]MBO0924321.1 hypothetical protein [Cellulomonas wangleii]QVI62326.1 hypothetical protein KG103_18305 [Cellulomonas wangleii]